MSLFTAVYPTASPGPHQRFDHHISSTLSRSPYPQPANPVPPTRWNATPPFYALSDRVVADKRVSATFFKRFMDTYLKLKGYEQVGQGVNGTAYKIELTPSNIAGLRNFYKTASCLIDGRGMPTRGIASVVVKIEAYNESRDYYKDYLERVARESSIHSYLSDFKTCTTLRVRGRSQKFCSADVVPAYYFSGTVAGRPYWVTVMSLVDGVQLGETIVKKHLAPGWYKKVSRRDPTLTYYAHPNYEPQLDIPVEIEHIPPTENTFRKIEKAVATLYVNGVVHADLHHGNIMISSRGRITILDFGFATMIPPPLLPAVRRKVSEGSVDDAWYKTGLSEHVDWILKSRGYDWYNPNAKVLRNMWLRTKGGGTPTTSAESNDTHYETAKTTQRT